MKILKYFINCFILKVMYQKILRGAEGFLEIFDSDISVEFAIFRKTFQPVCSKIWLRISQIR
jgi:hypothetical protein